MKRYFNRWWSGLAAGGGVFAAFGAAACCALPLMLVSAGIGSAWLGGISPIFAPYRDPLLALASVLLLIGAFRLWGQHRAARACPTDTACASLFYRAATLAGLIVGTALVIGAIIYG